MMSSSIVTNMEDIKQNWDKYRCRPDVMMMASLYGKDAVQNLQFCLKNGFDQQAEGAIAPFYTFMAQFVGVLTTLLGSINSVKMIFATIIGSATTVFSEFSQRIQALFYRIQMTAIRMKFMMGRVFAIMYSIMYMGMSGMRAGLNFSNSFLFTFLDTFCFDPDTPIAVKRGGVTTRVPIKSVRIGDVLANGEKVTATFQFAADGQHMVSLGEILVSTNHYVRGPNGWVQARDHPDASPAAPWAGGTDRPLICLNTDTHSFQIGNYTFCDYDETAEGDQEAMGQVLKHLNGAATPSTTRDSTMACAPTMPIKMKDGKGIPAQDIRLGTVLSHGTVAGIVQKVTTAVCEYGSERFAPGTALWCKETQSYRRAGDFLATTPTDEIFYSFVVVPSAVIETTSNTVFRDYVEIHDPDLEKPYAEALLR